MLLDEVFKDMNKQFKKELAVKGIGEFVIRRIPFTSPRLNYETYGGIPRGRISMFAGKESSGKTSTALDAVKNAQIIFQQEYDDEVNSLEQQINTYNTILEDKNAAKGKREEARKYLPEVKEKYTNLTKRGPLRAVYFDAEGTIDSDWAKKIGVDVDNVYLVRLHTQTAEQFLDQVMTVVTQADNVGLIVIDSIAVLVPQLVHGESFEQKSMGGNAKVVTDFCNMVCPILGEKDIACIIINQARDDFSNPYADFKIPCGNGLKLASSLILTFQKGRLLDAAGNEQKQSYETPQGNLVWVRIQKTKICKPDRRVGFYTLSYDHGIDVVADLIPMAVEMGIIKKGGAWYSIMDPETGEVLTYEPEEGETEGDPMKFQGQINLMNFLRENEEVYKYINDYVMEKITGTDKLRVDEETDKQAIADLQSEVEVQKIEEAAEEPENTTGNYEAPNEYVEV